MFSRAGTRDFIIFSKMTKPLSGETVVTFEVAVQDTDRANNVT